MVIFRIEHETSRVGLYNIRLLPFEPECYDEGYGRRPLPHHEGHHAKHGTHLFGFKDLRQMVEWLASETWLDRLIAAGYVIRIIRPVRYTVTPKQAFYEAQGAVTLSTLGLHTIRAAIREEVGYATAS